MRSLVCFVVFSLPANWSTVEADTFIFAGCEIKYADTGYVVKTGKMASIINKDKKLVIEVYRFSKVPKSDKAQILKIMKPRKNTTNVVVTDTKDVIEHGVTGTEANGTAKINGGPVRFKLRSIPVDNRAVVVVAFMRDGDPKEYEKELGEILKSLKPHEQPEPIEKQET